MLIVDGDNQGNIETPCRLHFWVAVFCLIWAISCDHSGFTAIDSYTWFYIMFKPELRQKKDTSLRSVFSQIHIPSLSHVRRAYSCKIRCVWWFYWLSILWKRNWEGNFMWKISSMDVGENLSVSRSACKLMIDTLLRYIKDTIMLWEITVA